MARTDYRRMIDRIREAVRTALPPGADVLVVSKGDPALVAFPGARARHFPEGLRGEWAGYHPASSYDALLHLEELRTRGAEYLLLPRTAYWWLGHYTGLAEHLERHCRPVPTAGDDCRIFALGTRSADPRRTPAGGYREEGQRVVQLEAFLDSLLPVDAKVAVIGGSDGEGLRLGGRAVRWLSPRAEDAAAEPGTGAPDARGVPGGEMEYVMVLRRGGGSADEDRALLDLLGAAGHLLAHRVELGWLFEMVDVSTQPAPRPVGRGGREESR